MRNNPPQVSGIEGSYRNTCEISMRVLRDNKESLMAVLEAFVYDPLINWRLMPTKGDSRRPPGKLFTALQVWIFFLHKELTGESARTSELSRVNAAYAQEPVRKLKADENTILNGNANYLSLQHPANTRTQRPKSATTGRWQC
jgi:FKBP12-rapamycin complex-associated protein